MEPHLHIAVLLVLIVAIVAFFSFLAVGSWMKARVRERQAFYQSEMIKRIAETQEGASALEYLRDGERMSARHRREGQKLGGLITLAVGIGIMIFLRHVPISPDSDGDTSAYLVGIIPALIGVALMAYAYLLAPKN